MSRILEKLADQHEERMINVLYKLEEDVVKEVTRATKGQLVSQRLAIQLRPKIKELVENNFLNEADLIINEEYNKIAKEVLDTFGEMPIPNKFKSLTEANLSTINALKFQSYSGFEDIGERFIKVINDELYQSTIAGRPFEDMVSNIRSHINGVYKKSNQREINELVDFINENKYNAVRKLEVEEAVRKLHTQYASDRAGNNLRRYAGQIAHDSVMQFHGQFTIAKAKESGLTHFTYTGTLVRDSRDWCRGILGKTYTEKQIRELWNTRSWNGKANGDPFIVRGGYRCRHTWIPTDPSWGEETVDELPEEPVIDTTPEPVTIESLTSSPRNKALTDATLLIQTRSQVERQLKQRTETVKKDYDDVFVPVEAQARPDGTTSLMSFYGTRFRPDVKGNYAFQVVLKNKPQTVNKKKVIPELTDESASVVNELMKELDILARKFKIPRLNGVYVGETRRNVIGAMGDGQLFLKASSINNRTKPLSTKPLNEKEQKRFDKLLATLNKAKEEKNNLLREMQDKDMYLTTKIDTDGIERLVYPNNDKKTYDMFQAKLKSFSDNIEKLTADILPLSTRNTKLSTAKWKIGDGFAKAPYNAMSYFDNPIDRMRQLFYHEFGHHVHQMYGLNKKYKDLGTALKEYKRPPVERKLPTVTNKALDKNKVYASQYMAHDSQEYFAEQFGLYFMDRKDLVDPKFKNLIEDILKEANDIN